MKSPDINILSDPVASAKAAGLRYVSDEGPGIRRMLRGKHFFFLGVDGKLIDDEREITRIRALAVPGRTPTCGSVRIPTATCRQPGAMLGGASNTATTSAGAKFAMTQSSGA